MPVDEFVNLRKISATQRTVFWIGVILTLATAVVFWFYNMKSIIAAASNQTQINYQEITSVKNAFDEQTSGARAKLIETFNQETEKINTRAEKINQQNETSEAFAELIKTELEKQTLTDQVVDQVIETIQEKQYAEEKETID